MNEVPTNYLGTVRSNSIYRTSHNIQVLGPLGISSVVLGQSQGTVETLALHGSCIDGLLPTWHRSANNSLSNISKVILTAVKVCRRSCRMQILIVDAGDTRSTFIAAHECTAGDFNQHHGHVLLPSTRYWLTRAGESPMA